MRIGKALLLTETSLFFFCVSHSRKATAVNSRDQSIRPRGAGAPALTVYPERHGKLESSINRTVRSVCSCVCVGEDNRRQRDRGVQGLGG